MAEKREVSEAEFVTACCTVISVLAVGWWKSTKATVGSIKRSTVGVSAAMDCQAAAKYCGFGRTRFRQLVADGVFPQPVVIEGRKRWLAKDLDVALAQKDHEQQPRK